MSQVDIPLSNISDLEYLGNFPSPPYVSPHTVVDYSDPTGDGDIDDPDLAKQEEEGWYFYLGEVAMRWVENRIFHGMYSIHLLPHISKTSAPRTQSQRTHQSRQRTRIPTRPMVLILTTV
jgi:hypothetical protein